MRRCGRVSIICADDATGSPDEVESPRKAEDENVHTRKGADAAESGEVRVIIAESAGRKSHIEANSAAEGEDSTESVALSKTDKISEAVHATDMTMRSEGMWTRSRDKHYHDLPPVIRVDAQLRRSGRGQRNVCELLWRRQPAREALSLTRFLVIFQ
jgi:hypothetical protein